MSLVDRLANALAGEHAGLLTGDFEDNELVAGPPPVPAAVLVAITDRPAPGLILTQRTEHMRRHAGQIAFPGGRIDPGDVDAIAAALREAEEEIALPSTAVAVAGVAGRYRTGTGYEITPVVGVVPPDLPLAPHEAEVAAVFEVPLAFVLDPAVQVSVTTTWQGRERGFYQIEWQNRRIWGATAAIIVNLARVLRW